MFYNFPELQILIIFDTGSWQLVLPSATATALCMLQ